MDAMMFEVSRKIRVFPAADDEVLIERLEHLRQAAPSLGEGAEDASTFLEED